MLELAISNLQDERSVDREREIECLWLPQSTANCEELPGKLWMTPPCSGFLCGLACCSVGRLRATCVLIGVRMQDLD